MIGTRINYWTTTGDRVQVLCTEERASLPVFDIEIVDRYGEVLEYIPNVMSHTALTILIDKRGWLQDPPR